MAKRNGKTHSGDSLTVLRQTLAGKRARLAEIGAGFLTAVAERDTLAQALPDLRSRGLVHGEEKAKAELSQANLRLAVLADTIGGFEHDIAQCRGDVAELEAQLSAAERAERLAERDALLRERDSAVAECIASLRAAGAALQRAGVAHDGANRINAEFDERAADWRIVSRTIQAVAVLELDKERGRYPVDLSLAGHTTAAEARRYLSAAQA